METIKTLQKQADKEGFADYFGLVFYWTECNNGLHDEFKTFSSKLLLRLLDDCYTNIGEYNKNVLYKMFSTIRLVLAERLRINL